MSTNLIVFEQCQLIILHFIALHRLEHNLIVFLQCCKGEGLYGIGLQLIIAAESGVEADELHGLVFGYLVDQFFGDLFSQQINKAPSAIEKTGTPAYSFTSAFLRLESCFQENSPEQQGFLRGRLIHVVDVLRQLQRQLLCRDKGIDGTPLFKVGLIQFQHPKAPVLVLVP